MSTIINATTTNGVVIQPDNSGSLVLQTNNGTTALTISTAQNATFAGTVAMGSSFLRNRIINGDMRIDQRNAGASVTPNNNYALDRWAFLNNQTSKFTCQQNAGSVTPPEGFSNYLGITSSSSYTILAGDYFQLQQSIEGFNTADLDFGKATAKTITISFWARSSLTGNFGIWITNSATDRVYPTSYTISSANTWTYCSVTIPGDTSGTWIGATNGRGIRVVFNLGYGSTYVGGGNAWNAGTFYQPAGCVNLVATSGATLYITGVQLEIGTSATPFERRMYGQELALCQRYYAQLIYAMGASQNGTAGISLQLNYPVTMRASPTIAATGVIQIYDGGANYTQSTSGVSTFFGTQFGGFIQLGNFTGLTAYRPCFVNNNGNANAITAYAEL